MRKSSDDKILWQNFNNDISLQTERLLFRCSVSGDNRDMLPTSQNRHVSLANIATAFLSERKSSSRRTSSGRRKKRLAMHEKKGSGSRNTSSFSTGLNDIFGQRLSSENMESNIAAIFMTNISGTGANNKHRTTVVSELVAFSAHLPETFQIQMSFWSHVPHVKQR